MPGIRGALAWVSLWQVGYMGVGRAQNLTLLFRCWSDETSSEWDPSIPMKRCAPAQGFIVMTVP
jgi:hypothetical protein